MHKKKIWIIVLASALIATIALAVSVDCPVLFVNGTPICQQEFNLNGQSVDRVVRSHAIMEWADEAGVNEYLTYSKLLRSMEKENRERLEKKEKGEPVYGPSEYNSIQYYKKYIGDCEQGIKYQIEQTVAQEDLISFYDSHLQDYRHIDTVGAEYSVWQGGVQTMRGTVQLDQYTVRGLSESSEEFVEQLMQLQPQQQIVWDVAEGVQIQLLCIYREPGTIAPFEEVAGAVSQQYAAAQFESQLEKRVKEATVWNFIKKAGGNS